MSLPALGVARTPSTAPRLRLPALFVFVCALAVLVAGPVLVFGAPAKQGKKTVSQSKKKPQADRKSRRVKALKDLKRRDKKARRRATRDLGRLGGAEAEAALDEALGDSDKHVRQHAIRSLGLLRVKKSINKLKRLAVSKDIGERELAQEALARIATKESAAPVAAACRQGEDSACRSLQWATDDNSISALRTSLADDNSRTRSAAVFALARRGERKGLREIAEALLADANSEIRTEAAHSLGILGARDKSVLPVLEAALTVEKNDLTRQVLDRTIRKLATAK